jgi:hypothetical protein
VAHNFRGIYPTGIAELATILDREATSLRTTGRSIDWLLRSQARNADASQIAGGLTGIEAWATESATDLRWRATAITNGQQATDESRIGIGAINPRSVARFAVDALFASSVRSTSFRSWLVTNEPQTAAAELRQLGDRIDNWSGSDNDPILDGLIRQAQQWREALGVTTEAMAAVATTMHNGQTPAEVDLPEYLFPPDYVDDVAAYESQLQLVARLEAESQLIVDQLAEAEWGSEEFRSLREQLSTKTEDLDSTQDALSRPAWETPQVHEYLLTNPLLDYRTTHQTAGTFLAHALEEDPGSLSELSTVSELLGAGTTIEAQAFFDELGPIGTAALPGALGAAANTLEPGGAAHIALRHFAEALAAASHRGLSFSGSEVLPPYSGSDYPPHLLEVNPAVLFQYGRFDAEFVIDAALRPLEDPFNFASILDAGQFGTAMFGSVDELRTGVVLDMRLILLSRVAELGPDAAVDFIAAATERGVLDELVRPGHDYIDSGIAAGGIIAQLAHDIEAARTVVATIGAEASSLPPGVAVGAEDMFLPHATALIQGDGPPSNHLVTPVSPLASMEPDTLDAFLRSIFLSGAGIGIANEVDETVVFEVYTATQRDIASAHAVINSMNDELGQMIGRVEAAEFLAGEELAKNRDRVNAARARISGMLLEAGLSLVPVGRLAGITWNTAEQVGSGMAADVSVGALTDRTFPTDAAEHLYRAKIYDAGEDIEKGADLTIALLRDLNLLDTHDMPSDPDALQAWLDNTHVDGTGLTVDDWVVVVTGIYAKGLLKFDDVVFD